VPGARCVAKHRGGRVTPEGAGLGFGIGSFVGGAVGNWLGDIISLQEDRPDWSARPSGLPTGTVPIDQAGLSRAKTHKIKDGVGAGRDQWTGVDPNGNVWVAARGR